MSKSLEAIISRIIGMFIVSSLSSLTLSNRALTREEAIEVGKGSELVRERLTRPLQYVIFSAHYETFGAWDVDWQFYEGGGPEGYYVVYVVVDAETGRIIHEYLREGLW